MNDKNTKAQRLLERLLEAYNKGNIREAWKCWCGIYDLFEPPRNANDDEKFALFMEQQKYIAPISNSAVYAITDYGRSEYYSRNNIL